MGRTGPGHVVGERQAGAEEHHGRDRRQRRRHRSHRHLISDARTGMRRQGAERSQAKHHLVRLQGCALRRKGLRGTGSGEMSLSPAELTGKLHAGKTGMGEGQRTGAVRENPQGDAPRRLHRHEAIGRDKHHHQRTLRGHRMGLQRKEAGEVPPRLLRLQRGPAARHRPDIQCAEHRLGRGCQGARPQGGHTYLLPRRRPA